MTEPASGGRAPISVCMATYNGGKYIERQLRSILCQLGHRDEVLISDDSSEDNTIDIITEIGSPNVRIFPGNTFRSPALNIENALKRATGDSIFLADQDDIWEADKVDTIVPLLEKYDLVVSDCMLIDAMGNCIAPSFFDLRGAGPGVIKNIFKNTYLGCCMAFRRSVLDVALPFPANIPMHDMWLGLIAEKIGRTCFSGKKLVRYRRHASNASPTGEKSRYSLARKISFRYRLISSFVRRYYFGNHRRRALY